MSLLVRTLEEGDKDALTDPAGPWWFKKRGRAYLDWLLGRAPEAHIPLVAVADGAVVGYYLNLMTPLKADGRALAGYHGGVFVHPEHRSRSYNVLTALIRRMHDEVRARRGVMYGFPTPALYRYYSRRLGMRDVGRIPAYAAPTRLSLARLRRALLGPAVCPVRAFDERWDRLWEQASGGYGVLAERGRGYLEWRYLREPGRAYPILAAWKGERLLGYVVLGPAPAGAALGVVVDLFCAKAPGVAEALVAAAVRELRARGIPEVECRLAEPRLERALLALGFTARPPRPESSERLYVKSYAEGEPGSLYLPDRWLIARADMIHA